jgi:hypothetical protein
MSNKDRSFIERICILAQDSGKIKESLTNADITTTAELREFLRDSNKINSLKFKDKNGDERDLSTIFKRRLRHMESYINYSQNRWGPIYEGMVDMSNLTADDFETFMSFGLGEVKYDEATAIAASERRNSPTSTKSSTSALDLWNKHSVHKMDDYPHWKKAYEYSKFYSKFKLIADVQNLSNVLQESYLPATYDDRELFQKQCHFIYCVLDSHVTFGPAATLIKKFEYAQYNGQQAWLALVAEFNHNMYGELRRDQLYKMLTTVIIPEQHSKPYQQYVTEFKDWHREYNELASTDTEMSPASFLLNFERFITNVPNITTIKHQLRAHKFSQKKLGIHGTTILPDQEIEFLTDYITQIDAEDAVNQTTARELQKRYQVRRAHMTELEELHSDFNLFDYADTYDRDYGVYSSASDYGEQDGRLPHSGFQNLSQEGKKTWKKFSVTDRKIIIQSIIDSALEVISDDDDDKPTPKPPTSNHLRRPMTKPVAQRARVNATQLVPVQDDDDVRVVNMASLVEPLDAKEWTGMLSIVKGEHVPPDNIDELPPTDIRRQLKDHHNWTPALAHKHPADPTRLMSPKNVSPIQKVRITKKGENKNGESRNVPPKTTDGEQIDGEQLSQENGEQLTKLLKSRLSSSKIDKLKKHFNL